MTDIRYSVYFTPLIRNQTYGTEVDVSDRVLIQGISSIKKSIDDTNYDIGIYTFGDITLRCINADGLFNEDDYRSMFITSRDLTQVRVVFTDSDGDTVEFRGLINDEATRVNLENDEINFKVLALDSALRTTKVPAGSVANNETVSSAIFSVLNQSRITSVLTLSEANINPDLDVEIDDGSAFENRTVKDAINELLLISNSVFLIDSSNNIIVKSRGEDTTKSVLNLFGKNDIFGRENIIRIGEYNNGRHRMFNSVKVNNTEESNTGFESDFGTRQKSFNVNSITTTSKETTIAERLVDEFKTPKIELEVTIPTTLGKDVDLLDRVSINYPLRLESDSGMFLPVYGITQYGSTDEPYPTQIGSLSINQNIAFKVISIKHNPRQFETTLKLRQSGTNTNDGVYSVAGSQLYGFARYGESRYA